MASVIADDFTSQYSIMELDEVDFRAPRADGFNPDDYNVDTMDFIPDGEQDNPRFNKMINN